MPIANFLVNLEENFSRSAYSVLDSFLAGQSDFPATFVTDSSDWLLNHTINSFNSRATMPYPRQVLNDYIQNLANNYWHDNCIVNASPSCPNLQIQLFGAAIANGFILNQNKSDLQREILHALQFTAGMDDRRSIIIAMMQYCAEPKAGTLQSLSWSFSRASHVITGSGPTWDNVLPEADNNPRSLANNFRLYGLMLQRTLENIGTENVHRPREIAEQRLTNLIPFIKKHVGKSDPGGNPYITPTEYYSILGTLMRSHEIQSNFPSLNEIIYERGEVRSKFKELTPSCLGRFGHWLYGAWTDYGTSISKPIFLLFMLYAFSLSIVLGSIFCNQSTPTWSNLNAAFELMTLRSEKLEIWSPAKLFVEVLSTGYIGLLLSYLFSFFANWR